jgi:Ca2+-binding RTX toxin-like protein
MHAVAVGWLRRAVGLSALALVLVGSACDPCTVKGTDGDDVGAKALVGTPGEDVICGLAGNDHIDGRGGDDVLIGGAGNDVLDGGGGNDAVDYLGSSRGVRVDLAAGTAVPSGPGTGAGHGTDTIVSVRRAYGTAHDDVLIGNDQDNELLGRQGNDALYGGAGLDVLAGGVGDDHLDGGGNDDQADYSSASGGVYVNLATGLAGAWLGGAGQGNDTLVSIRRVRGSRYHDYLVGDDNDNVFHAGDGIDTLKGGMGADTLRGEGGDDTLEGEQGPDHLWAGDGDDHLVGGPGDDEIRGEGGDGDWTSYADAPDFVRVIGAGASGGAGDDVLGGIEHFEGSPFDDVLWPESPTTLRGLGGNDYLIGDPAKTTVDYSQAEAGVEVNLLDGTATGGEGDDTLSGIKHITGSWYDDVLTGDETKNTILGGNGNDELYGRAQDDTLDGEQGTDFADGAGGNDTCTAEATVNCP